MRGGNAALGQTTLLTDICFVAPMAFANATRLFPKENPTNTKESFILVVDKWLFVPCAPLGPSAGDEEPLKDCREVSF